MPPRLFSNSIHTWPQLYLLPNYFMASWHHKTYRSYLDACVKNLFFRSKAKLKHQMLVSCAWDLSDFKEMIQMWPITTNFSSVSTQHFCYLCSPSNNNNNNNDANLEDSAVLLLTSFTSSFTSNTSGYRLQATCPSLPLQVCLHK
jgi:hypothetical protein